MSALSSLLVRDDVVSIQRIEDALQRQVLEGGDIDTALLELNAAPENVINSYRAAMFSVPAASREQFMTQPSHVLMAVPREVAERFRVAPLWIDRDMVVLGMATPPSERVLQELTEALRMRLSVRIATEMRVEAALAVHYGIVIPGRLRQLAEHVEKRDPGSLLPVSPLRSSTMPPPMALDLPPGTPVVSTIRSQSIGAPALPREHATSEDSQPRRPPGVTGTVPGGFQDPSIPPAASRHGSTAQGLAPSTLTWKRSTLTGATKEAGLPAAHTRSEPPAAAPAPPPPVSVPPMPVVAPAPPVIAARESSRPPPSRRARPRSFGSLRGPLTRERAEVLLDEAEDRNAIIEVCFAFARQYFDCAAMFSLREDRAVGLESYGLSGLGDVRAISVPLERTGTLDEVVRSLLPRVADLSRRPADRRMASVLGRLSAQPAALVPICLRQRVVLFLYGDRGGEAFTVESLSDLVEFVPVVSRTFERVIRANKVMAAGALSAMRAEEEAAAAANLPPVPAVPVLALNAPPPSPVDMARAPTMLMPRNEPVVLQREPSPLPFSSQPPPAPPPHTLTMLSDSRAREALSTLGVGRQPPPPPSPEQARQAAALEQTDLETSATQKLRPPSPLPPATTHQPASQGTAPLDGPTMRMHSPMSAAGRASVPVADTYTLLSGKPADARSAYSHQGAATDVVSDASVGAAARRASMAPAVTRSHSSAPPPPSSRRSSVPPRPGRVDARTEGGTANWTTEVVRLPDKPITGPPPRQDEPTEKTSTSDVRMPSAELERLVRDLCASGPDSEGPFVNTLLRLGEGVVPLLVSRFPGPLWFDRSEPFRRLPPGRDISAIARALHGFHLRALPHLLPLLSSSDADARFYALLLCADIDAEAIVGELVPLLSDADVHVKDLARTLLLKLRNLPSFRIVLEDLRGAVAHDAMPIDSRVDAVQILSSLRDADSVDVLVFAMSADDHRVVGAAHDALRVITGHDFGNAPRKWQVWFSEHGKHERIVWLIDGLTHADESVRSIAANELQRATQQYFGFHPGSPKRERERVQELYRQWWRTQQQGGQS